jgi:acyl-coenzyme A thioesterase PaaI-like protein
MAMHLVYPDPQIETRTAAATAVRRLAEALVGHVVDDGALAEVTAWANAAAERLERGEVVVRADDYQTRRYTHPAPQDGDRLVSFTDRPVSGPANPTAQDLVLHRVGDEVVGVVRFGRLSEASPGRAHGGMTAAVFDDVMGYVMLVAAVAAYTGSLTVRYLKPLPIREPVEFRGRVSERKDRVWTVTAEARANGEIVSDAEGQFVVVPPERFGL